jgi:hypothetical protein
LQADQNLTLNITLELGDLAETITVAGEAAQVTSRARRSPKSSIMHASSSCPSRAARSPDCRRWSFDEVFNTPLTYNYNLAFEREVTTGWMARAAYVGSTATTGRADRSLNPAIYTPGRITAAQDPRIMQFGLKFVF